MIISPPMPKPVLADTGPLYALADTSDQYHSRAQAELAQFAAAGCYITVAYPTLAESYTLVLRRLGTAYAHLWLHELMDGSSLINPEPSDYIEAIRILASFSDQPITLFDAVTGAVAERLGLSLWTYDRHFDLMRSKRRRK